MLLSSESSFDESETATAIKTVVEIPSPRFSPLINAVNRAQEQETASENDDQQVITQG